MVVANALSIPKERVFGLVPTGARATPGLCPYTLVTPDDSPLPPEFRGVRMENVWQFNKVMAHIPKHTQMLNRRGVWKNSTPVSVFEDEVRVDKITGKDWLEKAPPVVKTMLSSDDPIRSYVPKRIRHLCMGSANPYDLDTPLLDYVSARVQVYNRLYIESVLADPRGKHAITLMKEKLEAGENILLYETDGPTSSMIHHELINGVPIMKATPNTIRETVQTHTMDPTGHCFFLAAHLLGVSFEPSPSTVRQVTVKDVRTDIQAALSKKRAREQHDPFRQVTLEGV